MYTVIYGKSFEGNENGERDSHCSENSSSETR